MAFKLKPYSELVALSKKERKVELAPQHAEVGRKRAELELAEMDAQIATYERSIVQAATDSELNVGRIADSLDEIELLELRRDRMKEVLKQLFP